MKKGKEMKKDAKRPVTRTKNPEPSQDSVDWIIWAAWADRITFEEIKERTGLTERDVISLMRRSLKRSSFKRWRKRVHQVSIKNRKKFEEQRKKIKNSTIVYEEDSFDDMT